MEKYSTNLISYNLYKTLIMADYEIHCRLFTVRCIYDTLMVKPDDPKLQRTINRALLSIGEWIDKHPPSTETKQSIQLLLDKILQDNVLMQFQQTIQNILETLSA
jgi:hypothetical protein